MASNADFVKYIAEQCAEAGEIMTKKMFGDYAIYCNGKIFGLICDDRFYIKPTTAGLKLKITSTLLTWTTMPTFLNWFAPHTPNCLHPRKSLIRHLHQKHLAENAIHPQGHPCNPHNGPDNNLGRYVPL